MQDSLLDKARRYNVLLMERQHRETIGQRLSLDLDDAAILEELGRLKVEVESEMRRRAEKTKAESA